MANLYELTGEILALQNMASDLPEEDQDAFIDTMEALSLELHDKADAYAKVIKNLTADVDALKDEEKRLEARRKAIENHIKAMKQNLYNSMVVTGDTKFKTQFFSFGVRNNPASVVLDVPEWELPSEYLIEQEPKVDKTAISNLLKSGKEVDFAHLEVTQRLSIS